MKPTEPPPLEEVPEIVARIADRQRRLRVAGIVVVIGMLLGFGVGGGTQQFFACRNGNQYRAHDLQGWIKLADTLDPGRQDPRTKSFLAYQTSKDALRNCNPL